MKQPQKAGAGRLDGYKYEGVEVPRDCPICGEPLEIHQAKQLYQDTVSHYDCADAVLEETLVAGDLDQQALTEQTIQKIKDDTDYVEEVRDRFGARRGYPLIPEKLHRDVRTFETGATRDTDENKLDFEAFLSPAVLVRFAQHLHKHRKQSDGNLRAGDNWQKGMDQSVYMKSMHRHFMDVWCHHRGLSHLAVEDKETALCALMFNVMGMLFEELRNED